MHNAQFVEKGAFDLLGLPKGTEVQKQLPKKLIFEKFNLNTAAQEKFNANIARIYIVNEISPATTNIAEGETVKAVYVLQILLKKRDYDPKEILLIARLIEQRLIFVLSFEEQISVAVVRGRLLASDWHSPEDDALTLNGLNMDAVWENLNVQISGVELQDGHTLDEQLAENDRRDKLLKEITKLEKLARAEKQPKKKFEIVSNLNHLKQQLKIMIKP